jgi:hypothetical protein
MLENKANAPSFKAIRRRERSTRSKKSAGGCGG